jgi:2-amino-4-hydroxy-6-hydroxymethyldihydropteridine diphosphokinase
MALVYLSLGSNIGNRKSYICQAESLIIKNIGDIINASQLYETEPWGTKHPEWFLNKVISVETGLTAFQILDQIHIIESDLGRVHKDKRYAPRTIDIDILLIEKMILNETNLIIPHPLIRERKFVLEPLAEIAGQLIHPLLNKSIQQMFNECTDKSVVKKVT